MISLRCWGHWTALWFPLLDEISTFRSYPHPRSDPEKTFSTHLADFPTALPPLQVRTDRQGILLDTSGMRPTGHVPSG